MGFSKEKYIWLMNLKKCSKIADLNDTYMLGNYNLIFSHTGITSYTEEVVVEGIIPMDLANIIYAYAKDIEAYGCVEILMDAPEERFSNKRLDDIDKIKFEANSQRKTFDQYYKETMIKALKEDYENCYVNRIIVRNSFVLDWVIDAVKKYHDEKRNKSQVRELVKNQFES